MGKTGWVLVLAMILSVAFAAGSAAYGAEEKKDEGTATAPVDTRTKNQILESRLSLLQTALEEVTEKNRNNMPSSTKELIEFLPNKEKDLINPETEKPIVMNPTLGGQMPIQISKPAEFITFWADAPTPEKGRAVIYADSKLKYLDEKTFKKVQEASKLAPMSQEERRDMLRGRRGGKAR